MIEIIFEAHFDAVLESLTTDEKEKIFDKLNNFKTASTYMEIEKQEGVAILKRLPSKNKFEYLYRIDKDFKVLFSLDMETQKMYIRTLIQRGSIIDSFQERGRDE
ncbi:hypothetical protein [Bacillus sp. GB_SG_008]|uniref:hypothetical protein n=1 Tax=Bacillus sp. GB_SG_008 TaxID=3454627 RepID=UPI003F873817